MYTRRCKTNCGNHPLKCAIKRKAVKKESPSNIQTDFLHKLYLHATVIKDSRSSPCILCHISMVMSQVLIKVESSQLEVH